MIVCIKHNSDPWQRTKARRWNRLARSQGAKNDLVTSSGGKKWFCNDDCGWESKRDIGAFLFASSKPDCVWASLAEWQHDLRAKNKTITGPRWGPRPAELRVHVAVCERHHVTQTGLNNTERRRWGAVGGTGLGRIRQEVAVGSTPCSSTRIHTGELQLFHNLSSRKHYRARPCTMLYVDGWIVMAHINMKTCSESRI